MPDRGKVMQGLEWCIQHGGMGGHECFGHYEYDQNSKTGIVLVGDYRNNCPYRYCETGCAVTLARDALTLLKEQEARVMTLEEIRERSEAVDPDPVFVEWEGGATAWIAQAIDNVYSAIKTGYVRSRVWTSRPTNEQRKAVAWND